MHKGSCECRAVTFQITGPLRDAIACHCSQCRKTSGHYWAGTLVKNEALDITKDDGLKWFRSSDFARRGFCTGCGASLFYQMDNEGSTSVAAGALEDTNKFAMAKHIFVADKGNYYEITDQLEQIEQF